MRFKPSKLRQLLKTEYIVTENSFAIGFIRERATWCYPVYHLFDSVGSHTMKIRGPFCHFGCFDDVVYHVTNCEGQELATVTKR